MADVKYAINVNDGRLVFATVEVAKNPSYFVLHAETVKAIQAGKIKALDVLKIIKSRVRTAEEIAKLRPENVRKSALPKPDPIMTDEDGIKIDVPSQTVAEGTLTEARTVSGMPPKGELAAMKADDLRSLAVAAGKDVSGMNKSQIIDALTGAGE
ncbi:MAG: hypothetical protein GX835_13995 [Desulfobulbaceae bacterium]|jgi:hypothetical protein|nr:hypothetical protein [Desulfobulbaceae bacterium]